jgi:hypothetical protein
MRLHNALLAVAVIGAFAAAASGADARRYIRAYDGAYANGGSYYSYGAGRANPSFGPRSLDQTNPRDQQLQGHN